MQIYFLARVKYEGRTSECLYTVADVGVSIERNVGVGKS